MTTQIRIKGYDERGLALFEDYDDSPAGAAKSEFDKAESPKVEAHKPKKGK
jgi:hypothetical protein